VCNYHEGDEEKKEEHEGTDKRFTKLKGCLKRERLKMPV
jgi:hypothetical protein